MAEAHVGGSGSRKSGRAKRVVLIAAGVLVFAAGGTVALAPAIAGSLAPGLVAKYASASLNGEASIESASFSWGGPQQITGLKVSDASRRQVASVKSIDVSAGLLGLIGGGLDVGTVTISGVKADVTRARDGTTNVQGLSKPSTATTTAPSTSPASIPEGLRAKVVLKDVAATFTDAAGADGKPLEVAIENFNATAQVGGREPLKVAAQGSTKVGGAAGTGSIMIDAVLDGWIGATGEITPRNAKVDAKVEVTNLPPSMLDALAPAALAGGSFREGLGDAMNVTINAKGGLSGGTANIEMKSPNLNVAAKVAIDHDVLTSDGPVRIDVTGRGLAGLSPAAKKAMKTENLAIDALPDASITIDQVRFAMPTGNATSLKGSGAVITARLGELKGQVTMQEGTKPQSLRVAPLALQVDAKDLAGAVRVTAATEAQVGGRNAGAVSLDVNVQGLLDPSGAIVKGMPASVRGEAKLIGLAAAIVQPFADASGLKLVDDVGPTLDAGVKFVSTAPAANGTASPIDVDVNVTAQNLAVSGGVRWSPERLSVAQSGLRLAARRPAAMASRFIDPAKGLAITAARADSKGLTVTVKSLDVPMTKTGKPDASAMAADLDVSLDGLSITAPGVNKPVELSGFAMRLGVAKGGVKGTVSSTLSSDGAPCTLAGTFDLASLLVNDASGNVSVAMDSMRPVADIQLKDVPVTMARLVQPAPVKGETPLDFAKVLKGVAGDTFSVSLSARGVDNVSKAYDVNLGLRSARLTADIAARGGDKAVEVRTVGVRAAVEPETVRMLASTFAPDVTGMPRLLSSSTMSLTIDPITIPVRADHSMDLASAGIANVKLSLPGRTLVGGLTRKDAKGVTTDLGVFGVEEFSLTASAPVAALVGPASNRATRVHMAGTLLGGEDAKASSIGLLDATLSTELSDKAVVGPVAAKVQITQINVGAIERIIGQRGKLSGAVGDTASMQLAADVKPAPGGVATDFTTSTTTVSLSVDAPRFRSDGPISATLSPESLRLNKASRFTMSMDPSFVNAMAASDAMRITELSPVTVTLDRMNVPMSTGGKATFDVAVGLKSDRVSMQTKEGKLVRLSGIDLGATSQKQGPKGIGLDFHCVMGEASVDGAAPTKDMAVRGSLDGLVDGTGVFDPSRAMLNVQGDLAQIPTPLIDLFVKRDGTVIDALGPVAGLTMNVQRYPLGGAAPAGTEPAVVELAATSARATASMKGTIRDGMYVSSDPLRARVVELIAPLSARYIKALPLLGTFEKTMQDAPATLEISSITAPLGGDLSKLNAEIVFDPGEARFATSGGFGELLKLAESRTGGQVGRKLGPLKMHIRNGVATYETWQVPVGKFVLKTEGTVDLVRRQVDVVTYVPIGAVSDRVVSGLNAGKGLSKLLPGVVEALTEVPFRTRGSMDAPSTDIDFELVAKNAVKQIDTEKLIDRGLKELFGPKKPAK